MDVQSPRTPTGIPSPAGPSSHTHGIATPAVERAAASGEVRIVIVIPEYEGVSIGTMWEDLKMGVENWGKWKRIALVTDVEWMIRGTEWFGWKTPGEIKRFPLAERAEAIAWAAG
jgi:stage II sporulation SpoAA-like protein